MVPTIPSSQQRGTNTRQKKIKGTMMGWSRGLLLSSAAALACAVLLPTASAWGVPDYRVGLTVPLIGAQSGGSPCTVLAPVCGLPFTSHVWSVLFFL
jgi:hypothetical protein